MWDFNIGLLKYHAHEPTNDFVNTFLFNNYLPCINHPPRITDQSTAIIDNIFTNVSGSEIISGNILAPISDNFPPFLILKDANMYHIKSVTSKYDYSSFSERVFIEDFYRMEVTILIVALMLKATIINSFKKPASSLKDTYQLKNVVEKN